MSTTKQAHEQNPIINHLKRSNFFKDIIYLNLLEWQGDEY